MKKSLATLALVGSIALIGTAPVMAATPAPYPAPSQPGNTSTGTLASEDEIVAPGEPFTWSGGGMDADEQVQGSATLTSTPQALGGSLSGVASMAVPTKITLPLAPLTFPTVPADGRGNFAIEMVLTTEGTYTLTARGLTSGHTVIDTIKVDASGSSTGVTPRTTGTGSGLAETGADANLVLWSLVGAGALAAGVGSVVVVRRRAKADASV